MTQKTKVIVGAVVVLGALYLYDRSRKMKAKEDLVSGADVTPAPVPTPTIVKSTATIGEQKELNFAGSRGNSMTAQYYR